MVTKHKDPAPWLDALAGSHDRLAELVADLGGNDLRRPSYCTDWSVAQVLSHLGSGAEIYEAILGAALAGEEPPGRETFPAIWQRWDEMSPEEQAEGFMAFDGRLVESLERLGDRLDELEFVAFGGMRLDAAGLLGMRLSEHAVHAWDVAVSFDAKATLDHESVVLLVDRLPQMARHVGKPERLADRPARVTVRTTQPPRTFHVYIDDVVKIGGDEESRVHEDAAGTAGGDTAHELGIELPAEAFVRLVYGRLHADHAPSIDASGAQALDVLTRVFPGF